MVVFRILQMLLLYDWHEFFLVVADPDLDGFFSNKKGHIYSPSEIQEGAEIDIHLEKKKKKQITACVYPVPPGSMCHVPRKCVE